MEEWKVIEENIVNTLKIIFSNYNINKLNPYQKRKIIFEYLTNILTYDYDTLEKIRNFQITRKPISRDPVLELSNVIYKNNGICNGISQYYKLLLEKINTKSYCVICDDGTLVKHQLNLVYNDEIESYSFDDVTSVIVGRGDVSDYFDYDLSFANSVGQGNKVIMGNECFFILPESYINFLVKREVSFSEKLDVLPKNIVSKKYLKKSR